jgi:hypothetical protein
VRTGPEDAWSVGFYEAGTEAQTLVQGPCWVVLGSTHRCAFLLSSAYDVGLTGHACRRRAEDRPRPARCRRPTTAGRTGQARSALWRPGPSVRSRVAGRSNGPRRGRAARVGHVGAREAGSRMRRRIGPVCRSPSRTQPLRNGWSAPIAVVEPFTDTWALPRLALPPIRPWRIEACFLLATDMYIASGLGTLAARGQLRPGGWRQCAVVRSRLVCRHSPSPST